MNSNKSNNKDQTKTPNQPKREIQPNSPNEFPNKQIEKKIPPKNPIEIPNKKNDPPKRKPNEFPHKNEKN